MRQYLRGFRFRQAVIHCPIEVIGNLRGLARSNQTAHRNEASVPRRQGRTQPQFTEKQVGRVLHDTWSHKAEILQNGRSTLCLGGFIEGQKLRRGRRKLIWPYPTLLKNVLGNGNGCERVRPPPTAMRRPTRSDAAQLPEDLAAAGNLRNIREQG